MRASDWKFYLVVPFLAIGLGFADRSWEKWLGIAASYWVFSKLFTFFEELNENLRYIRHRVIKDNYALVEQRED